MIDNAVVPRAKKQIGAKGLVVSPNRTLPFFLQIKISLFRKIFASKAKWSIPLRFVVLKLAYSSILAWRFFDRIEYSNQFFGSPSEGVAILENHSWCKDASSLRT